MGALNVRDQSLNMYEMGFRQYEAGSAPLVEFDDGVATIWWSATEYLQFEASSYDPVIGPIYDGAQGFSNGVLIYSLYDPSEIFLEGNAALEAFALTGDGFALFELLINGYPEYKAHPALYGRAEDDLLFGLDHNDTLEGDGGNDELIGNEGNDALLGDAIVSFAPGGDDALDGGPGSDRMEGGLGNDTYYVDDSTDKIIEDDITQGDDQAFTGVSYTLAAEVSVETLSTADQSGSDAIDLTGNELGNWLVGNAGNNNISAGDGDDVLQGWGGTDTLTGGIGNDFFCFSTLPDQRALTTQITDFTTTEEDTVALDGIVFRELTVGVLDSAAFRIGAAAEDADDRIIYNATTGALTYDNNGVVSDGDTTIAMLTVGLVLRNTDFLIS
ncbi:Ca2+-binding RTX toxin-like protein [Pararhizobium capsulatum DSM 1112]|uniref:Ca2+-binding RTX toxin-like protein n=1 Tax=Pararhizobium capsulatum DSM 1112 TaxID=1121113 RepID=A0ABU0BXZ5_9HYPH|nr:calcium-binding protein [Pararhizobium capsulatum]MDQ0322838.1 Ca2+-binding RTX toxin-like protein [Pararhizobium capsulatum DSM 1112]